MIYWARLYKTYNFEVHTPYILNWELVCFYSAYVMQKYFYLAWETSEIALLGMEHILQISWNKKQILKIW